MRVALWLSHVQMSIESATIWQVGAIFWPTHLVLIRFLPARTSPPRCLCSSSTATAVAYGSNFQDPHTAAADSIDFLYVASGFRKALVSAGACGLSDEDIRCDPHSTS